MRRNDVRTIRGRGTALWLKSLERLVRVRDTNPPGAVTDQLDGLRHYPALLAIWTMGIAAVLSGREEFIAPLLTKPMWARWGSNGTPEKPAEYLHPWRVIPGDLQDICPPAPGNKWLYPQSHLLRREVHKPLRLVEPDDSAYQAACSRFELLASLIAIDAASVEWRREPWPGEFLLDQWWGYDDNGLAGSIKREIGPD